MIGDLNYDDDVSDNLFTNHYINLLHDMQQLISEKTQTTVDIFLPTMLTHHARSGVEKVTLSDHYVIFSEVRLKRRKTEQEQTGITYRDYKHSNADSFISEIKYNDFHHRRKSSVISWDTWK